MAISYVVEEGEVSEEVEVPLRDGGLPVFKIGGAHLAAELDARRYRGLRLPNGLLVILASDPEATKAAKNPTPKSVFRFLEMKTKRWVDSMGLEEGM